MPPVSSSSSIHLLPFPQHWEKLGFFLPRPLLDWAEIHAVANSVSESETEKCLDFWSSRKIALVKQTAYQGLYPESAAGDWISTVLRSGCHLGPFSFLADLGADYWVVRQADEPETFLWREKYSGATDSEALFEARMEDVRRIEEDPGLKTFRVQDVKWDQYDLVIGIDVPVPEKIVRSHPKTLWAYISAEAGGPLQKNSLRYPLAGYQLFLNHGFRRYRSRPSNRSHVLEFPFTFQSAASWKHLAKETTGGYANRRGAVVDRASWQFHAGEKPTFMTPLSGDAAAYIRLMSSSEFAIRTDPKTRWGNWALEAIQAGCLFLGRADSLAMPGVLLPDLIVTDLASADKKIEALLNKPLHMQSLARTQAALAEHLAFRRPLMDLTARAKQFFQS